MKINQDYIVQTVKAKNVNVQNINAKINKDLDSSNNAVNPNNPSDFKQILDNTINSRDEILFSKHANKRLNTREINITKEQMNRVEKGIENAKEKGIRDTLVLVDNIALVVNTKNNVVITAMTKNIESVFTNIDGAVIV